MEEYSYFNGLVDSNTSIVASSDDNDIGVNFNYFTSDNSDVKLPAEDKGTKKKKSSKMKVAVNGEIMPDANIASHVVDVVDGAAVNTDYAKSYAETNNLIRGAIIQADQLSADIKKDLDEVRGSKTIKSRYTYITNLTASAGSLLSTKIAAIKELNSSITQAHNLELNRYKALKLDKKDENDDMKMMDIYSAFVNTPVGVYNPPASSIQDITLGVNNPNGTVSGVEMVSPNAVNGSGLTPEQNRMRMESNPNIQVVVRYDVSTGQRAFDVVDKSTGMSVPNYPRPDNFLLEDTTIDVHAGIARNRNVNTVWPLITSGDSGFITEY